jgi:hypothetical protein
VWWGWRKVKGQNKEIRAGGRELITEERRQMKERSK